MFYNNIFTMKLKKIKYPKKIKFEDVKDNYNHYIEDKNCFILIRVKNKKIEVGICNYKYELVKAYRRSDVQAMYKKIIDDGWIKEMKHAAYLGMELQTAKDYLQNGKKYVQRAA